MAYEIRELSLGEVLDQAIAVLKNRFGLLLGIVGAIYFPLSILIAIVQADFLADLAAGEANEQFLILFIPLFLLQSLIVLPITYGAIIHAIAKEYLQEPTGVGEALRVGAARAIPLIWTMFLFYLAMVGGLILCVIPGILFMIWLSLAAEVVILERQSGFAALGRSRFLTRGNLARIFVLWLVVAVIQYAAGFGSALIPNVYVQTIVATLVQNMLFVFATAVFVVLYFSCRSQHEGFDLARLAEAVRAEEHATATGAAAEL